MGVLFVVPVAILNAVFWTVSNLCLLVADIVGAQLGLA